MPRSLHDYRGKRDAQRTNEPLGDEVETRPGATWRGAFVMHQHDATRMHYDLRLEVGGVLASFAIPHGPTLDPSAKHLAVHTEDHPIEYLDFEAIIPEKNYGAGPMIAWDMGSVRYLDMSAEQGLVEGKLHFALEGKKLRGRFGLVRMKPRGKNASSEENREWLFIKKQDAHARVADIASEQPRSVLSGLTVAELTEAPRLAKAVEAKAKKLGAKPLKGAAKPPSPMLCTLGDVPPHAGWIYELKMDGVRVIAHKSSSGVTLTYRSGRSATPAYPEVARAIAGLAPSDIVLDGEIVAFDDKGRPSFERLATRIHRAPRTDLRHALAEVPVVFVAFDLPSVGGLDLTGLPLVDRKALLRELLPAPGVLRILDHLEDQGDKLLEFCVANGLEGVVSKRADSPYVPGPGRTTHWIKTKCTRETCFVIVGWTQGEGGRHRLGALEIASYEGDVLHHRGRVGSGIGDAQLDDLLARLEPLKVASQTSIGDYEATPRTRFHVEPKLVVRVRYLEFSEAGHVRFPVFLGLEHDIDPMTCRDGPHDEGVLGLAPPPAAAPEPEPLPIDVEVKVTNRSKIFWTEEGYTKGDLVDYYAAIAPTLLPYLEDRPIMLVRYPDGIAGKSFYQWNVPHGMPGWVRSVVLGKHVASADEADHKKHVFIIDRPESLVYIANLACIPVHVLGSRVGSPSECDFVTIDFDVNLSTFEAGRRLALTLRGLLAQAGLEGFPKTSGQTGLHVFIPLGGGVTPTAARTLADLFGRLIVERHPDLATMERVVNRRGAKVYVDTGQTGPSRTIVAPYSVRATKGARVSTPITWAELEAGVDPAAFTIRTVLQRVERLGDPMAPMLDMRPDIGEVMAKLATIVAKR